MEVQEFTELVDDLRKVQDAEFAELKRLATEYPYSQAVQLMYALKLQNSSEHLFSQQLGRTAILTNDRTILYDIFEGDRLKVQEPEPEDEDLEEQEEEVVSIPVPKIVSEEREETESESMDDDNQDASEENVLEESDAEIDDGNVNEEETEEDESSLPAAERIKRILERSRNLRKEFEDRRGARIESTSERVKQIRDKYESIKRSEEVREETDPEAKDVHPEQILKEERVQEQETKSEENGADQGEAATEEVQESENTGGTNDTPSENKNQKEEKQDYLKFAEWIKKYSANDPDSGPKAEAKQERGFDFHQKAALIDSFVEKLPKLKVKTRESGGKTPQAIHMGEISNEDEGALITETLARVYLRQGHLDKAIKAYRILQLKYPEKSSFFADQILEINKLKHSK